MKERVDVGVGTDVGRVRSENQDHYDVCHPGDQETALKKGLLVIVADGMGGHSGGTVASRTAVDAFAEAFRGSTCLSLRDLTEDSFNSANKAVRVKAANDPELQDMGTTCVSLLVRGRNAMIGHLGDSRCYFIREGAIEQVTKDHTYLNELVDAGFMTEEQAEGHPDRNIITRCVGMSEKLEIDFNRREIQNGDTFVLCSDGLTNFVSDPEICEKATSLDPDPAVVELIDLANERGGEDNITVAIVRINEDLDEDSEIAAIDADDEMFSSTMTPVISRSDLDPELLGEDDADVPDGDDSGGRDDITPVSSVEVQPGLWNDDRRLPWAWILGAEVLALVAMQLIFASY